MDKLSKLQNGYKSESAQSSAHFSGSSKSENDQIKSQENVQSNSCSKKDGAVNHSNDSNYYQTLDVYPNPDEVLKQMKPHISKNITEGCYKDVEEYLDIHFRLLREDFMAPLRKAIGMYKECLQNGKYVKITEFHVYPKASFCKFACTDNTVLNTRTMKDIIDAKLYKLLKPGTCAQKLTNKSDSFMHGSLLCFSFDNFETIFFGTCVDLYNSKKGYVNVRLLEDIPFLYNKKFTMLECTNYFNPYCLVLKVLQNIDSLNFSMKEYIIDVKIKQQPPAYLTPKTKFSIKNSKFGVLDGYKSWPSKESLNLNNMQYEAFKHALTSKFAVIQGPPGTGKTYLGLMIAKTLIENYKTIRHASGKRSGPILIISYTNHALDQFLEGLIPYTKKIVRIGKRSKNEKISKFTLKHSSRGYCDREYYYERMNKLLKNNQQIMQEIESALSYYGIFNFKRFTTTNNELPSNLIHHLTSADILLWLFGNFTSKKHRDNWWVLAKEISKDFQSDQNQQAPLKGTDTVVKSYYILTISRLENDCRDLKQQLEYKNAIYLNTIFEDWNYIEQTYEETHDILKYLKWRLQHAKAHSNLYSKKQIKLDQFNKLPYNDRWILYFHCLDLHIKSLQELLKQNNLLLTKIYEELEKDKQQGQSADICGQAIVGMTTSGAAKNQHLLKSLKCPIVIVEEAAEILESHVVASLTQHCEHLILIGDHQQLRPSTADYQIGTHYQLGISLFERMVRNGIHCSTLDVQHRMRPEICRLITPAIYHSLKNHSSVYEFANIQGITHSMFFVNHEKPEIKTGTSKKNPHEAKYVIALAKHLILQGYNPSEITILTTYRGQFHEIKKNCTLKNVRIDVVDNFQGEENEIILLSLVRSNERDTIGFLALENRVCVALSRAKKGFYIIGNLNILAQNSKIWPKIKEVLTKNKQVGIGLQLTCQLHPENITVAVEPEDFQKVPDGGCSLPCGQKLECGHICQKKCHIIDQEHKDYRCMEPCTKFLCELNHVCPKLCWQKCGKCTVPVERTLPCEHQQMVPCAKETEKCYCLTVVKMQLKCGHQIEKPCFKKINESNCVVEVETIKPSCGHTVKKKCYKLITEVDCTVLTTSKLKCGHDLQTFCKFKDSYSEKNCYQQCLKILECGHSCLKKCHYLLDAAHSGQMYACQEECTKLRAGCKMNHKCKLTCSKPCTPCDIKLTIKLPCDHLKMVLCSKSDKRYVCKEYCKKFKPCGHICYSKCHAVCNAPCPFKVFKKLPNCGHKIKVSCSDDTEGKICSKCMQKM